jgi:hypothetical protein
LSHNPPPHADTTDAQVPTCPVKLGQIAERFVLASEVHPSPTEGCCTMMLADPLIEPPLEVITTDCAHNNEGIRTSERRKKILLIEFLR